MMTKAQVMRKRKQIQRMETQANDGQQIPPILIKARNEATYSSTKIERTLISESRHAKARKASY